MAKVFIEESNLTAIGEAIRSKTGKTDLLSPASMASEIESITTGGGSEGGIAIPAKGIYTDAWDANGYAASMKTVGFTNDLITKAFYYFSGAKNIVIEINEGVTQLNDYTFNALDTTSATILLPSTLTTLGTREFLSIKSAIEELVIPAGVTVIPSNTFQGSTKIKSIILEGKISTINTYAFSTCTGLEKLIMPNIDNFVTLSNTNALSSASCDIYIPDEWVTRFKGATNWSTLSSRIKPISELGV